MKNNVLKNTSRRYLFDIIIIIVILLVGIKLLFPDILKPSTYNIYINTNGESVQTSVEVPTESEVVDNEE